MQIEAVIDENVRAVRARIAVRAAFRATYRVQLAAAQFRFADALGIAGYLADLGASHLYASPIFKARRGSTHGYDVVDPTRLNDELGSDDDFAALTTTLRDNGLGLLVDIVPNHMCVATDDNAWWMDVLMNGPASPFAGWFDIDWRPVKPELRNRVLLPVLGDNYGRVLEAGELQARHRNGAFFVACGDSLLPLDPRTWTAFLLPGLEQLSMELGPEAPEILELRSIVTALERLPARVETANDRVQERRRERIVVQGRLRRLIAESPRVAEHVDSNLRSLNGDPARPESLDELDRLLDRQAFRLVHWKAGSDELNYRRFFDVTELGAVSMERLDVFETTHRAAFALAVSGQVDGFRIDHVDGMFDPAQYLWRLQWQFVRALAAAAHAEIAAGREGAPDWSDCEPHVLQELQKNVGGPPLESLFEGAFRPMDEPPSTLAAALSSRGAEAGDLEASGDARSSTQGAQSCALGAPAGACDAPLFVLVEKILGADEPLPPDWPVEGTTGYDFLNLVNGLFVDPRGLRDVERHYARFVDAKDDLRETIFESKRLILGGPMHSEVQLLAHRLDRLSNRHRNSRDYTLQSLRSAIREIIAAFPVYRTYVTNTVSDRDRRVIHQAVAQARRRNPTSDPAVLNFVRDVLLLEQPPDLDARGVAEREQFVGRFQQVSSPVMAKGVEDTAFYRHVPLTSLEEVGGEPSHAVTAVDEFHRQNAARLREWPRAMLATTTHDTKRTEDARARINVLSEMPGAWHRAVSRWSRWNRNHHRDVDGEPAPSRNDEWLFYQSLVGVWPLQPPTDEERTTLIERLRNYMEKAIHEAKLRTSWISPNAAYDEAVREFVSSSLDGSNTRFLADVQAFHDTIVDAGLYASLSQTLLKLTSPGVPDIYQGQELWDFSLVDPDNRRPVDFALRKRLLDEIVAATASDEGRLDLARRLAADPRDPRMKLFVTWTALQFRHGWPDLSSVADYVPLEVADDRAEHVVAFAWVERESANPRVAVIVAPRLLWGLTSDRESRVPCGDVWGDTRISLKGLPPADLHDHFTGRPAIPTDGTLPLATALREFPLALLTSHNERDSSV